MKKEILKKLLKEDKITFDEMLVLLETETKTVYIDRWNTIPYRTYPTYPYNPWYCGTVNTNTTIPNNTTFFCNNKDTGI